jgi:DNA-binding PadR family transcriptional regulator
VSEPSLTPTSYLVLGLVGGLGECTSYDMKAAVNRSIGHFWTFPHSQLYAEPARLADLGLLESDTEESGRRRRTYRLTKAGRHALDAWLGEPTASTTGIRDLALLKLFFGGQTSAANVRSLAESQVASHREMLGEYESMAESVEHQIHDAHHRRTLEMGLRFERAAVAFWEQVAKDADELHAD